MRNEREAHSAFLETQAGFAKINTLARRPVRLYRKPSRWRRFVNQLKKLWSK